MSTSGRPSESAPAPSDVAATCRDAGLVRLAATADGDALAATGLLARALAAADVPFQASVARLPETTGTEADVTVTVGASGGDVALVASPVSTTAYGVAGALGDDPDPVLALAGAVAAGVAPGDESAGVLEAAEARGVTRRPGVAVPTDDLADGLAHTTLAHAGFSGDPDATAALLAERDIPATPDADDEDAHRRAASLLALAVARTATPRGAEAVAAALHPYVAPDGPFETVGGYADVLGAVARERPGTGVALALGEDEDGVAAALDAWRSHAARAHEAFASAETSRYNGLAVVRLDDDAPVATVARLLRDFRSPEPVALAVTDREAAAATCEASVADPLRAAAAAVGGDAVARRATGYARLGADADAAAFVDAFRGAVS